MSIYMSYTVNLYITCTCRHLSVLWYWPYCISVSEGTFGILLELIQKFRHLPLEDTFLSSRYTCMYILINNIYVYEYSV